MGRRTIYLEYGGDFVISPQGGLLMAEDNINSTLATQQRMIRLINTTPLQRDQYGNVTSRGDSYFYKNYGAGARTYVDATPTPADIAAFKASILDGIAQDPGIARVPAPVVSITLPDTSSMLVYIQVTTTSGQTVTIPDIIVSTTSSNQ